MRTDDLIGRLAAEGAAQAAPGPKALTRRMALAAAGGLALAVALLGWGWGFRSDLAAALPLAPVQLKFALSGSLALGAFVIARRAAEPGRGAGLGLGAAPLVVAAFAAAALWPETRMADWVPPVDRAALLCAGSIAALAMGPLALAFAALRAGAPTALRRAGGAAGLAAGGLGGVAYALYCPIDAPGYVAFWYPAGALVMAAFGALLGPRLLAW